LLEIQELILSLPEVHPRVFVVANETESQVGRETFSTIIAVQSSPNLTVTVESDVTLGNLLALISNDLYIG